jgi:hypothetical protein
MFTKQTVYSSPCSHFRSIIKPETINVLARVLETQQGGCNRAATLVIVRDRENLSRNHERLPLAWWTTRVLRSA